MLPVSSSMELYVHELDKDVLVVAIDGGLNAQTAEQFTSEVEKVAARGFQKIIVDCAALSYISSSGIGALLLLSRRMKAQGAQVKVAVPHSPRSFVLDVLRVARLDTLFEIYPDVSRARLSFMATGAENPGEVKAETRTRLKLAVAAMTPAQRESGSRRVVEHVVAMPEWAAARSVLLFWPRVDVDDRPSSAEPDIRPLIDAALKSGKTVCLPRTDWTTKTLVAAQVTSVPDDLEPDTRAPVAGLMQPKAACPPVAPLRPPPALPETLDLILVPGLGFDLAGRRIGRGAGLYDRLLADLSTPPRPAPIHRPYRLGIAFDAQILREIPAEPHDQPVHAVATPAGIMRVSGLDAVTR